jgi:hypothetical protein
MGVQNGVAANLAKTAGTGRLIHHLFADSRGIRTAKPSPTPVFGAFGLSAASCPLIQEALPTKLPKRGFERIRTVMHSPVQSGMVHGSIGNNVNKFNLLGGIFWLRTKASKLLSHRFCNSAPQKFRFTKYLLPNKRNHPKKGWQIR